MIKKLTFLFLLISGYASAQLPDSTVISGGTAFGPAWRFKGNNASNSFMQFQNPLTGKYFGFYSAFQQDNRFVPITRTVAGFPLSSNVTLAQLQAGYGVIFGGYNGSLSRTVVVDTSTVNGIVSKDRLSNALDSYVTLNTNQLTPGITSSKYFRRKQYFNAPMTSSVTGEATLDVSADFSGQAGSASGFIIAGNRNASPSTGVQGLFNFSYNGVPQARAYNIGGASFTGGVTVGGLDSLTTVGLRLANLPPTPAMLKIGSDKMVVPAVSGVDYASATSGIQNQISTIQTADYNISGTGVFNTLADSTKIIVWVGDSEMSGFGLTNVANRYPTQVSLATGYIEDNRALGGTSLKTAPFTLIPTKTANMAYLVIGYGTNDRGIGGNTPSAFQTDMTNFVNNAISKGWPASSIILVTPPGFQYSAGALDVLIRSYNTATQNVATNLGTQYMNMYDAMITGLPYGSLVAPYLTSDGTHPNDGPGSDAMTWIALPYFSKKFNTNNKRIVSNGVLESTNIKLRNFTPSQTGFLLASDRNGNVSPLLGLPDGIRALGKTYLQGSLIQSTAILPTGYSTTNDWVLAAGSKIYGTAGPTNFATFSPFSAGGITEFRNYLNNGLIDFYTSGGTTGNQVLGLRVMSNGIPYLPLGMTMQTGTSTILQGTAGANYGLLQLFDGNGATFLRNSWNVGSLNFFMSGGTTGNQVQIAKVSQFGRFMVQNGGTYTENTAARLAISSTTEGVLIPRMTTAQRDLIGGVSGITSFTGSGYTSAPTVTIAAPTGPGGVTATATATINVGTGLITGYTITNPGSGYITVPSVTVSGGGGSGTTATATINITDGLMISNLDTHRLNYFNNTTWKEVAYTSDIGTSLVSSFRNITSATTLLSTDATINVTSGTFTQPLSTASLVAGQEIYVKNSGTGTVTVTATSMDGQTSIGLQQYNGLTLQYTGVAGTFIIK